MVERSTRQKSESLTFVAEVVVLVQNGSKNLKKYIYTIANNSESLFVSI
jgi:hypothetical protein